MRKGERKENVPLCSKHSTNFTINQFSISLKYIEHNLYKTFSFTSSISTPSTRTPTLTGKQKTNKILTQTQRKYNLKYLRKS